METPLWELAGRPPASCPLPPSRSEAWKAVRGALQNALRKEGCLYKARSPGGVWTLLHGTPLPAGATWQDLVGDLTLRLLVEKAENRILSSFRLASWNLRWLIDPGTRRARRKRETVADRVDKKHHSVSARDPLERC